jgi:hypothetical protein
VGAGCVWRESRRCGCWAAHHHADVWCALQVMVRMLNETGIAAQAPPVVYASNANGRDPTSIFNEAGAAAFAKFGRKPDLILVVLADTNSDVRTLLALHPPRVVLPPAGVDEVHAWRCSWCTSSAERGAVKAWAAGGWAAGSMCMLLRSRATGTGWLAVSPVPVRKPVRTFRLQLALERPYGVWDSRPSGLAPTTEACGGPACSGQLSLSPPFGAVVAWQFAAQQGHLVRVFCIPAGSVLWGCDEGGCNGNNIAK